MALIVNLTTVVLASAGTIIVLFGEANKDGHLTRLGVIAVSCLAGALITGIAKHVISNRTDEERRTSIATLSQQVRDTTDRLDEAKRELAAVRADNASMRDSLARMPQERTTASVPARELGQQFSIVNDVSWSRYRVQCGPATHAGPPLQLAGGELVHYNVGFRGDPLGEPELYLEVGPWRYPLTSHGQFVVFPAQSPQPMKVAVLANLKRDKFEVHLVVHATSDMARA